MGLDGAGVFDIVLVACLVYVLLVLLKRTRRSKAVVSGIIILGALYGAALFFNLSLTVALLRGFFAVIVLVIVVIFSEEIRQFFEQVAHWTLKRRLRRTREAIPPVHHEEVEALVETLTHLAARKIGALVILRGEDALDEELTGGQELDGKLSAPLLDSIFDTGSSGHDGAVVIEENRVTRFGCHLPLSKNHRELKGRGTRHAAALGLAEKTDALCLVVSEERGEISIARDGSIQKVGSSTELRQRLDAFRDVVAPRLLPTRVGLVRHNFFEKVGALLIAVVLWFLFVHEQRTVYETYEIPIQVASPGRELEATAGTQRAIVTLRGPRRAFYFLTGERIPLEVRLPVAVQPGAHPVEISAADFTLPKELVLTNFAPKVIHVSVQGKQEEREP